MGCGNSKHAECGEKVLSPYNAEEGNNANSDAAESSILSSAPIAAEPEISTGSTVKSEGVMSAAGTAEESTTPEPAEPGKLDLEREWSSLDIAAIQRLLDFAHRTETEEDGLFAKDKPNAGVVSSRPVLSAAAIITGAAALGGHEPQSAFTAQTDLAAQTHSAAAEAEAAANAQLVNAALEEQESLELKEAQVRLAARRTRGCRCRCASPGAGSQAIGSGRARAKPRPWSRWAVLGRLENPRCGLVRAARARGVRALAPLGVRIICAAHAQSGVFAASGLTCTSSAAARRGRRGSPVCVRASRRVFVCECECALCGARVRARARAALACMRASERASERTCVRACVRADARWCGPVRRGHAAHGAPPRTAH